VHDRISVNSICFPGVGFRDLAGYWRELGARRVSLVSNLLLEEGRAAAQEALRAGDCRLETLAHPFLPPGQHLDASEESRHEARATLSRLIEDVHALGGRSIYLLTGGHGALVWEEAAQVFRAAVAPCVAEARSAGIALAIENAPPLYAHTHIAHTLRDAATLAEIADVGVCIEFFACWTEAGLAESIERVMPRCPIVQVCDYVYGDRSLPSRAVPGDGAIPVKRLLGWILRAGYRGVFDLEILGPRIDAEGPLKAVGRAADNVGEMLRALGA